MRKADGFALIDLIFVCGIIGLISSIALPRLVLAKQAAGSASAIATLRTISSSQLTFALTCGNGFYAPDLMALGAAPPGSNEPFIGGGMGVTNVLQRSSYEFRVDAAPYRGAPATCNGLGSGQAGQGYRAGADPTQPDNPRFFGVNANSQMYEHNETLFDDMPETGEPLIGDVLR